MVEKLLSVARADSGGQALEIRTVNLREIVMRAAGEWRTVAGFRTLGFNETATGGDLQVAGDKTALQQLLNILLDNAVKYTPAPGSVSLSWRNEGNRAVFKVIDSGIGIASRGSKENLRAFLSRRQGQKPGIGRSRTGSRHCPLDRSAASRLIAVESTVGTGSTFEVHLPLQRANP